MADVPIQGIEFEVKSNADKAANGLKKLADTLDKLKSATSGLTSLSDMAKNLKTLADATENLSGGNVKELASAIQSVGKQAGKLGVVADYLSHIASLDFTNLTGAASAIGTVSNAVSAGRSRGATAGGGVEPPKADLLPDVVQESGTADGISEALEEATGRFKKFGEIASGALKKVGKLLLTVAKGVGKVALGAAKLAGAGLKKLFDRAIAPMRNFSKGLSNIVSSFKRILFYRTVRTLIKQLGDAFKIGVNNIYQWSKALGGTFAQSMDSAASSMQYFKNSLGTALAPILNSLIPVLNAIVDKVVDVINAFNQLFAILGGAGSWTKAVKGTKEYEEAVDGAAAATKKFTLGIDELNVVNDDTSGGGGATEDFESMFEEVPLEAPEFETWGDKFNYLLNTILKGIQKLKKSLLGFADDLNEFNQKLYGAFTAEGILEKVQKIGGNLADALNRFVDRVNWNQIGKTLGSGLNLAINLLSSFIKKYNWVNLGKSIAEFINGSISEIDWENVGYLMFAKFKIAIETLAGFLLGLDMPKLAQAAGKLVQGFFNAMTKTVNNIPWERIGKQIEKFFSNIDWGGIASSISGATGSVVEAITTLAESVLKSISENAPDIINAGVQILTDLIDDLTENLPELIPVAVEAISTVATALTNPENLGDLLDAALKLVVALGQGLIDSLPELAKRIPEIITNITTTLLNHLPDIIQAGVDLLGALLNNLPAILENLGVGIGNLVVGIVKWLLDPENLGKISKAGVDLLVNLVFSIPEILKGIATGIAEIVNGMVQEFMKGWEDFKNVGEFLMAGLKTGLMRALNPVVSVAAGATDAIVAKAKERAGIASPSKVFAEIGEYMMIGLANGITGKNGFAVSTASGAIDDVIEVSGEETVSAISNRQFVDSNDSRYDEQIVNAVYAMANMIVRAIEDKDTSPVVSISDRDVYRSWQRGKANVGGSLVNVSGG